MSRIPPEEIVVLHAEVCGLTDLDPDGWISLYRQYVVKIDAWRNGSGMTRDHAERVVAAACSERLNITRPIALVVADALMQRTEDHAHHYRINYP